MEQNTRNKKPVVIAAVVLAVLLVAVSILLAVRTPQTQAGEKAISVSIYHGEALQRKLELHTTAEFLRGALEEQNLIAGEDGEFGLFVKTVDGVAADDSKQEWWCFTKGGEQLFTGVDETPAQDGDSFEITLTTGW